MRYKLGDNVYFDFGGHGSLFNFYLKLINGHNSFKKEKLDLKEFDAEIKRLEEKGARKPNYIKNKNDVLRNSKKIYDEMKMIIHPYRSDHRPDHDFSDADQSEEIFDPGVKSDDEEFHTPQEIARNMPDLEIEGSSAQRNNQAGTVLKILIPDQMLSRLPITLAQFNAENNSQKL